MYEHKIKARVYGLESYMDHQIEVKLKLLYEDNRESTTFEIYVPMEQSTEFEIGDEVELTIKRKKHGTGKDRSSN